MLVHLTIAVVCTTTGAVVALLWARGRLADIQRLGAEVQHQQAGIKHQLAALDELRLQERLNVGHYRQWESDLTSRERTLVSRETELTQLSIRVLTEMGDLAEERQRAEEDRRAHTVRITDDLPTPLFAQLGGNSLDLAEKPAWAQTFTGMWEGVIVNAEEQPATNPPADGATGEDLGPAPTADPVREPAARVVSGPVVCPEEILAAISWPDWNGPGLTAAVIASAEPEPARGRL